jgi:hypothetical protein
MNNHILTIEKAQFYSEFREIILIFNDLNTITEINYDALKYLVENDKNIFLPNVKELSEDKLKLLMSKKNSIVLGFSIKS